VGTNGIGKKKSHKPRKNPTRPKGGMDHPTKNAIKGNVPRRQMAIGIKKNIKNNKG